MSQIDQQQMDAQKLIQAFAQCNLASNEVQDQLIKGILMNTTHILVQFDNLLKQMSELSEKVDTLTKQQQKQKNQSAQQTYQIGLQEEHIGRRIQNQNDSQPKTFSNLYEIISHHLKVDMADLKGVIHRNIASESPEAELKHAQYLDSNKVNNRILNTLCTAYNCQIFIFNSKTKTKSNYGTNEENIVRIYQAGPRFKYLIKKNRNYINTQNSNQKKNKNYHYQPNQNQNKNQRYAKQFQNQSNTQQHQANLNNTIENIVNKTIQQIYDKQQIMSQFLKPRQIEEENQSQGIYCEQCGSGPYASVQSYSSHIHFKHNGRTPSKNKFHKNLKHNGK